MNLRDAAQAALEALEYLDDYVARIEGNDRTHGDLCTALRAALAEPVLEPVQEPVAWMLTENEKYGNAVVLKKRKPKAYDSNWWNLMPLYTAPPQRKPLTDEAMRECAQAMDAEPLTEGWPELIKFARAIERAHGIE